MKETCFHCDLTIPSGFDFSYDVLGKKRNFCCAGCLAIAETLVENNLTDFYRFRNTSSNKPEKLIPQELQELQALDQPSILKEISAQDKQTRTIELGIEGITCAACGWLIEKKLSMLSSVIEISVNVSTHRARLVWSKNGSLSEILTTLNELGYRGYPFSEDAREKSFDKTSRAYIKRLLVAGLGMMQVMTYALAIYIGEFQDISARHQTFLYWISALVATPVVLYSAKPFFQSAWRNLKVKQLGMNLPVSIAILSAFSASIYSLLFNADAFYFDSVVMFTFFLLIGRYLEHRARYRSLLKQQNFNRLIPLSVSKRNQDQSLTIIPIAEIKPDDILIINAGGIIPVDGILLENSAEINESVISGEFMPVQKTNGDHLISGSSNQSASLIMQVTHDFQTSHIQSLINLQQNAEQMKPDSVSLADKISHWYVLLLLILVIATGTYWWHVQPEQAFSIVLSVLVVSCPCALSLATPAVIAAATSQLSDLGLMIRSKMALSRLAHIDQIYFDKTGTLTTGHLQITKTLTHTDMDENICLHIAALLETISNHPIAGAFKENIPSEDMIEDLRETIGEGVSGIINGKHYKLGNQKFISVDKFKFSQIAVEKFETPLYLTCDKKHIATFVLEDSLKPTAISMIGALKRITSSITLLSGDSDSAVANTAEQLNIENYISAANPEEKLNQISCDQKQGKKVLMVGDGFNDVGALAAANVSITMGTGTNLSKTSSDAVLVSNDLNVIAKTLQIAKKVQRVTKQNLTWAIVYNLTAIPFAMMGLVPAWLAAIGMSLSSLIVVLNALRLRK